MNQKLIVKKRFDAKVKEIMRKRLAEKGIVMDDSGNVDMVDDGDDSKLSEEEKKKRREFRVKQRVQAAMAAKRAELEKQEKEQEEKEEQAFQESLKKMTPEQKQEAVKKKRT